MKDLEKVKQLAEWDLDARDKNKVCGHLKDMGWTVVGHEALAEDEVIIFWEYNSGGKKIRLETADAYVFSRTVEYLSNIGGKNDELH